jgi:hypothetical protein
MFKKYKYQKVGKILTKILKKFQQNRIIFSIPYLHFVRQHPKFSFIYPEVFVNSESKDNSYSLIRKINKNIKLIFQAGENKKIKLLKKKEVIIISNLINIDNYKTNNNHYTYDLAAILNKEKISTLTIFRNFTNKAPNYFKKSNNKFILPKLNYISWEIFTLIKIIKEKYQIIIKYKKYLDNINEDNLYFFKKSLNLINLIGATSSLRISTQIINIIKQTKPKVLFLPIEGHAWEKVLIRDLKEEFNNLKIIGIHFSSIINNDFTIRQNLSKTFQPDFLICNKYHNYEIIKKNNIFRKSKILFNNLKKEKKYKKKIVKSYKEIKCLVTPELNFSEVIHFIKLVKKILNEDDSIKFTIKLHPSTPKKEIDKITKLQSKSIKLSKSKSILFEYNNHNIMMYRGSTTCFDAAMNGLWLMYYDKDDFNINPLQGLNLNYNNFSDEFEFLKIIKKLKKLKKKENKYFNHNQNQNFINEIF